MSSQYFLDVNVTTGEIERKQALLASTGATDANKIPRTGPDGKLDASFMPAAGSGESAESVVASEALVAGDWVNFHQVGGVRRVRKAVAADGTKPGQGYVTANVNSGENATVYTKGINGAVPATGFTANDVGCPVFLSASTSGGCTKTPPASAGNIVQRLGFLVEAGATMRVQLDMSYIVKL